MNKCHRRKFSFAFGFVLLLATTAQAQPISKVTLAIYNAGASTPLTAPTDILMANVTCNQPPPTFTPGNPTKVTWTDPADATKVCLWADPGTGPLSSTPFGGTYEATLTATNSAGTSPESVRAPFTHPGLPPNAPAAVRVGR